jgi:type I restriction enzyme S subunit
MVRTKCIPRYSFNHKPRRTLYLRSGRARGSAQQNLSKGLVESFKLTFPEIQVVSIFDQRVVYLFEKIVHNVKECRTLSELRDHLLPKLMSGEIRVKDAEKMVEEVT